MYTALQVYSLGRYLEQKLKKYFYLVHTTHGVWPIKNTICALKFSFTVGYKKQSLQSVSSPPPSPNNLLLLTPRGKGNSPVLPLSLYGRRVAPAGLPASAGGGWPLPACLLLLAEGGPCRPPFSCWRRVAPAGRPASAPVGLIASCIAFK